MKKYVRPIRTCRRCRKDKPHEAHGCCHSCYQIERREVSGPYGGRTGNPHGRGHSRTPDAVASRLDGYALIRPTVATRREAAQRLGISYRTASRYEALLNEKSDT